MACIVEIENVYSFCQEPLIEEISCGKCVIDRKMILEWILEKHDIKVWTGFSWHKIESCGNRLGCVSINFFD